MKTFEDKKAFALNAIRPYWKDPSICGYQESSCVYLTSDGRKCVLGKYLLHPESIPSNISLDILFFEGQNTVLLPEAVGILSIIEWRSLQYLHDTIAQNRFSEFYEIKRIIKELGLFTFEEMNAD